MGGECLLWYRHSFIVNNRRAIKRIKSRNSPLLILREHKLMPELRVPNLRKKIQYIFYWLPLIAFQAFFWDISLFQNMSVQDIPLIFLKSKWVFLNFINRGVKRKSLTGFVFHIQWQMCTESGCLWKKIEKSVLEGKNSCIFEEKLFEEKESSKT